MTPAILQGLSILILSIVSITLSYSFRRNTNALIGYSKSLDLMSKKIERNIYLLESMNRSNNKIVDKK